jgi:hypothetical protein
LHLAVIAEQLYLASIRARLGCQPRNHLVGLFLSPRVDDTHAPFMHHLLCRRSAVEDHRHAVRRVAIALRQLRHQRLTRRRDILLL